MIHEIGNGDQGEGQQHAPADVAQPSRRYETERGELLAALIAGCRKVPGQLGYYRAMAGLQDAVGNLDVLTKHLPGAAVKALKDPELRKLIAVKQVSFESTLKKRTQLLLG